MNRRTIWGLLGIVAVLATLAPAPTTVAQTGDTPPFAASSAELEPASTAPLQLASATPPPARGTGETVRASGEQVADQSRQVWHEALVPMWNRLVNALPSILKAFALLLIFWIVAVVVGRLVTKLLLKTDVDNRLARDWGLDGILGGDKNKKDAFEKTAGTVVKWIILLFGFVAFFSALNLGMVAGPLQNILTKISSAIPAVLNAAVILLGYWLVATVLRFVVTKALTAVSFDQRVAKWLPSREVRGEIVGPSALVGRLLFYIILLIGIPPFLEALGQESLVAPLTDMFSEIFAFLPNILAALILLFIGKLIATIVREVVTNLLAATGVDGFARRFGFGSSETTTVAATSPEAAPTEGTVTPAATPKTTATTSPDGGKRVSEIVGAIAYFFVIIPVFVAAVDTLQIPAISEPVKSTLEQLLAAIPLILVAIVIVAIGYYIAKAVRGLVESFLRGIGFDTLPSKLGLTFLQPKEGQASPSAIAGTVVMAVILLLTAEQALAILELTELSAMVGALIAYLPHLLVGLAIILVGLSLASYVARLLGDALEGSPHRAVVTTVAKYAIIFLTFSMGLNQLGVGEDVVRIAVAAVLGGSALALGLAFGLGGRERAKEIVEQNLQSSGGTRVVDASRGPSGPPSPGSSGPAVP